MCQFWVLLLPFLVKSPLDFWGFEYGCDEESMSSQYQQQPENHMYIFRAKDTVSFPSTIVWPILVFSFFFFKKKEV